MNERELNTAHWVRPALRRATRFLLVWLAVGGVGSAIWWVSQGNWLDAVFSCVFGLTFGAMALYAHWNAAIRVVIINFAAFAIWVAIMRLSQRDWRGAVLSFLIGGVLGVIAIYARRPTGSPSRRPQRRPAGTKLSERETQRISDTGLVRWLSPSQVARSALMWTLIAGGSLTGGALLAADYGWWSATIRWGVIYPNSGRYGLRLSFLIILIIITLLLAMRAATWLVDIKRPRRVPTPAYYWWTGVALALLLTGVALTVETLLETRIPGSARRGAWTLIITLPTLTLLLSAVLYLHARKVDGDSISAHRAAMRDYRREKLTTAR